MKKKSILLIALILIMTASMILVGCGDSKDSDSNSDNATNGDATSDEVVTIKVNNFMPQETPPAQGTQAAVDKLQEISGGKMVAEVYYNGTLLGFMDSWQGTGDGAVDVAIIGPAVTDSNTILNNIFEMPTPFLPSNAVTTTDLFNELIDTEPALNEELSKANLRWLSMMALCDSSLHMGKGDIKTIADVKGIKIEGLGAVSSKYWEALGATTVSLDPGDYFTSCKNGVVDGMYTHWPCVNDYGLNDALHSHTIFGTIDPEYPNGHGISSGAMGYIVNLDKWNSLTEEQQGWLQEAFRYGSTFTSEADIASAKSGYDKAIENGDTITVIEDADLQPWYDAAQPVIDQWIADSEKAGFADASQVQNTLVSLTEKYSK